MQSNGLLQQLAASTRDMFLIMGFPSWAVNLAMGLVAVALVLAFMNGLVYLAIWGERRLSGFIQRRLGPNRLGPFGLLQSLADGIKFAFKEDIVPRGADKYVFILAPVLIMVPAVMAYAVIPWDEGIIPVDLDIGIFYFFAISSISTIPIFMAGWGSNNKWSLLGAIRAIAQMISYEVPLIFSLLGVVMIAGTLQITEIVGAQSKLWFIVLQPVAFLIYIIAATAEVNRAPFDLVEGESELVAGAYTEYSGLKFALIYLAEYSNMFAVSAIAAIMFLGGWQGPVLPPIIWFLIKSLGIYIFILWIRWAYPRVRVDQLMHFGWKVLVPLSLANVFLTGIGIYIFSSIS